MPLNTLDAKPALVVIDLQKGITAVPAVHPLDDIIQRSASLAAAFRRHGLPVVLVNVTSVPSGRTEVSRPAFTPLRANKSANLSHRDHSAHWQRRCRGRRNIPAEQRRLHPRPRSQSFGGHVLSGSAILRRQ